MKNLNTYIFEKLHINKNIKPILNDNFYIFCYDKYEGDYIYKINGIDVESSYLLTHDQILKYKEKYPTLSLSNNYRLFKIDFSNDYDKVYNWYKNIDYKNLNLNDFWSKVTEIQFRNIS